MWISFEMAINIVMTLFFGYVYFSVFTAFFIGNIRRPVGFFIMYGLHIAFTIGAIIGGFFLDPSYFLSQLHFFIITLIGVILLPFNLYNRNKRENLEWQLEDARERISELTVLEERERIARDLHDTLGQKLSMIGLKSDLAGKLISRDPEAAANELRDIRQTASIALKEVRELVAGIRKTTLQDEIFRVQQMLRAAEMDFELRGIADTSNVPAMMENVLSMCLKEAVTNVVKHSEATRCTITFVPLPNAFEIRVRDNGIGMNGEKHSLSGSGLKGIRERLEFVNGSLKIEERKGMSLTISVPMVITHQGGEG